MLGHTTATARTQSAWTSVGKLKPDTKTAGSDVAMGALSLYRSAPLRELCVELFGTRTFQDLRTPLVVSTVDVESSAALWWGTAALPDVRVADAVYASCAMPGLLRPGLVGGRLCMDGGVLDPLALQAVAPLADLVIAVVLEGSAPGRATTTMAAAPTLWWRAQAMATRDLGRYTLAYWDGPPLIVIRPEVHAAHPIRGADPARLIEAGYEAARRALARWDRQGVSIDGVHPGL